MRNNSNIKHLKIFKQYAIYDYFDGWLFALVSLALHIPHRSSSTPLCKLSPSRHVRLIIIRYARALSNTRDSNNSNANEKILIWKFSAEVHPSSDDINTLIHILGAYCVLITLCGQVKEKRLPCGMDENKTEKLSIWRMNWNSGYTPGELSLKLKAAIKMPTAFSQYTPSPVIWTLKPVRWLPLVGLRIFIQLSHVHRYFSIIFRANLIDCRIRKCWIPISSSYSFKCPIDRLANSINHW